MSSVYNILKSTTLESNMSLAQKVVLKRSVYWTAVRSPCMLGHMETREGQADQFVGKVKGAAEKGVDKAKDLVKGR